MSNHCKIEFYFKRKDMEALLKANPNADGIIVQQEIKPRKKAGGKGFENVASIKAYVHGASAPRSVETETVLAKQIEGCPYPPGCTRDDVDVI